MKRSSSAWEDFHALALAGCPDFMPVFVKAFYDLQAVKSLYWKHSGRHLKALCCPCVQPARWALGPHGRCSAGVRPEEAAAPSSCCTTQGQSGMCSLFHSPSKANITVGSTSPQEADIPFHGPQVQMGNEIAPLTVCQRDASLCQFTFHS